jgi:asparaginyl-tRNA synthetase
MELWTIKNIHSKSPIGTELKIGGWVKSLRKSKAFTFIVLNDGSTQLDIQIIADQDLENYEEFTKCGTGSSFLIHGLVVESQGKQAFEIQAKKVEFFHKAEEDYPLQKKGTSMEFLREVSHLRPRTNTFGAVFRVRHALAQATHKFFNDKGFFYVNTPIVTAMDAEGAGEMFRVSTLDPNNSPKNDKGEVDFSKDYFGKESYLAVTGQLEGEAFACGMGSIYTFGPTFRSENSNTSRHLSEFWMIEPEVAFADLDDVAKLGADYIQYMINYALEHCAPEMEFLNKFIEKGLIDRISHVAKTDFKKITYTEAINILLESNKKFENKVAWGEDLATEHERYLAEEKY